MSTGKWAKLRRETAEQTRLREERIMREQGLATKLQRIADLHHPQWAVDPYRRLGDTPGPWPNCVECGKPWPCLTAQAVRA